MALKGVKFFEVFVLFCHIFAYASAQETVQAVVGQADLPLPFRIQAPKDEVFITIKHKPGGKDIAYVYTDPPAYVTIDDTSFSLNEELVQSGLSLTVTLKLASVSPVNAGLYECFRGTSSTLKIEGCGVMLIIIRKPDPPVIELAPESGKKVRDDLILHCQTRSQSLPQNHSLPSIVEWAFDKDNIDLDRINIVGDTLDLKDIRREDKGLMFKCTSMDKAEDDSMSFVSDYSSNFEVVPEFGPTPADIRLEPAIEYAHILKANLASELNIACTVDCQPACDVSWEFKPYGQDSFSPAPYTYSSGGKLQIPSVLRFSHGEFRCVGVNDYGRVEHSFYLDVRYMLTPITYFNGVQTDVGTMHEGDGDVVLKCDSDSNPKPVVSWHSPNNEAIQTAPLKGPQEIINDDNKLLIHRYTSEAVLADLKCTDNGSYQCKSSTKAFGSMDKNISIEVKCPPRPVREGPKRMKDEYVWQIPYDLHMEFLLESWPVPSVKSVESEKDGSLRRENMPSDVQITLQEPSSRQPFYRLLQFRSHRNLTLMDDGRIFIITLTNSDYMTPFRFTIRAKGPPHPFTNLTVDKVSHNSVHLSWLPGFNGGEAQTFFVFMQKDHQVGLTESKGEWEPVVSDIPDNDSPKERVSVEVEGLGASAEYTLRIVALNSLGNTTSNIDVKTLSAPSSSMAAGSIVAIVLVIIIIIAIVVAVLFYIFVYRKRWGKGGNPIWTPKVPARVRAAYRRIKRPRDGNTDGAKVAPKEGRPIYLGKTKESRNVPIESIDPTLQEDDYANANDIRAPMLHEPAYGNVGNPGGDAPEMKANGDEDSYMNEDGLHYVSLDFSAENPKAKKRTKKNVKAKALEEEVTYSDIDATRTKAKQLEIQREEEERQKQLKQEEENPYEVPVTGLGTTV